MKNILLLLCFAAVLFAQVDSTKVFEPKLISDKDMKDGITDSIAEELIRKVNNKLEEHPAVAAPDIADEETSNIIVEDDPATTAVVHFEYGETEISRFEYVELDRLFNMMEAHPAYRWRISAYTDSIESAELRESLPVERAVFVRKYFTGKGIDEGLFEIDLERSGEAAADNATKEGRASNRRVKITRLKQKPEQTPPASIESDIEQD